MAVWKHNQQVPLPPVRGRKPPPPFSSITAVTDALGLMHVFAFGTDSSVWHAYETSVGNWTSFNSSASPPNGAISISAVTNGGGQVELFGLDFYGYIWHTYQTAPASKQTPVPKWSAWAIAGSNPILNPLSIAAQTLNGAIYVCCLSVSYGGVQTPCISYITSGQAIVEPINWSPLTQLNVALPGEAMCMWISPDPQTLPLSAPITRTLTVLVLGGWGLGSSSPSWGFYVSPLPAPASSNFVPIPAQPPPSTTPQPYPNSSPQPFNTPVNAAIIYYRADATINFQAVGLPAAFIVDTAGCLYLLRQIQVPTVVRTRKPPFFGFGGMEWVYQQYEQQLSAGSCWYSILSGAAPLAVCEDPVTDKAGGFKTNNQLVFYADNTGASLQALEYSAPNTPFPVYGGGAFPPPYTPPYSSNSLGTIGSAPRTHTFGSLVTAVSPGGGVTVFGLMETSANPTNVVWYWRR
jgi:hypothetical protein